MLGDLFSKKGKQAEILTTKAPEVFPQQANDLLSVIFLVRDDMDIRAAEKNKKGIVIPISK